AALVGGEIFEEAERQWPASDGPCSRRAETFVHLRRLLPNGFECLSYYRARAGGTGARDEVDQLAPTDRGVVAVAGRLVQHCQQAIVETHLSPILRTHRSFALRDRLLCAK